MGCLLFDDEIFCGQITKLLEAHCNRHIAEIGCIDLSHTLRQRGICRLELDHFAFNVSLHCLATQGHY